MSGELLNEQAELTVEDICENCGLSEAEVTAYVEEGLIDVGGAQVIEWRFSEISMVRLQKARRLERDLRLNPAGAALALELLEQIEELKNLLKRFEQNGDA